MKLIVGLGNPGVRYAETRHNVGFRVLERFAERHGLDLAHERYEGRWAEGSAIGVPVALLAPLTWMNLSGEAVAGAVHGLRELDVARDLVVVYDDLDLPFGRLRLRAAGGAGGHRGVASIILSLDTKRFARLRFGIGRPPTGVDPVDWVLSPFDPEQRAALPSRIERAVDVVDGWLADGVEAAMNRFNREPGDDEAEESEA